MTLSPPRSSRLAPSANKSVNSRTFKDTNLIYAYSTPQVSGIVLLIGHPFRFLEDMNNGEESSVNAQVFLVAKAR